MGLEPSYGLGGTVFVTKDGGIAYALPNNSSELRV